MCHKCIVQYIYIKTDTFDENAIRLNFIDKMSYYRKTLLMHTMEEKLAIFTAFPLLHTLICDCIKWQCHYGIAICASATKVFFSNEFMHDFCCTTKFTYINRSI